jgi:glyoxylase-like metal-dependent hydrolase (beta-lactamase superfamily II)
VEVACLRASDCRSFVVREGAAAVVVDSVLPPDAYRAALGARVRLVGVAETHVHSDHASTARALADAAWCPLHLPHDRRVLHPYEPVHDGDALPLGLVARAAPGHTAASLVYHGDGFVLVGDAFQPPDVDATPAEARMRAATQHGTLLRLLELPDETRVLPAHEDEATVAELRARLAPALADREAFVEAALRRRVVDLARVRVLAANRTGVGPPPLSERS